MEKSFWHERWEQNQIGFHQAEFNPYLVKHWPALGLNSDENVFVPFAGKSVDMLWLLEQGHKVLAVELSKLAVEAFFTENNLSPAITETNSFVNFQLDELVFKCGDFFQLTADDLKNTRAVFDRASLIALPSDMRKQYAQHMAEILQSGTQILLIGMEYLQSEMDGPPFSVCEAEIQDLFEKEFIISKLETINVLEKNPRFKERGLTFMEEKVFLLKRI